MGWETVRQGLARALAVAMALFHLYTAAFGNLEALLQRGVHLAFTLALIFLLYPRKRPGRRWPWDGLLLLLSLLPLGYIFRNLEYVESRFQFVMPITALELGLGLLLMAAVLEAARRVTGWALPAIAVAFLVYALVPNRLGVFSHSGYSLHTVTELQFMTTQGIFGIPLGASANYIALFIIFGAFLERSGLGPLILDLASGLAGRYRGGPAKVAVLASALTGTISGSAPANVLTTGTLTIPLMKRLGYPARFAGAVGGGGAPPGGGGRPAWAPWRSW